MLMVEMVRELRLKRQQELDRQNFLGRGRGEGERLMAGDLLRRLISSWGGERGQTSESNPVGSSHSPNSLLPFDFGQVMCALYQRWIKVELGRDIRCHVVIHTALSWEPEI